ncbi:MAG: hypothetical protein ACK523_21225, partial [Pirellulaceae bacterium]
LRPRAMWVLPWAIRGVPDHLGNSPERFSEAESELDGAPFSRMGAGGWLSGKVYRREPRCPPSGERHAVGHRKEDS